MCTDDSDDSRLDVAMNGPYRCCLSTDTQSAHRGHKEPIEKA